MSVWEKLLKRISVLPEDSPEDVRNERVMSARKADREVSRHRLEYLRELKQRDGEDHRSELR